MTVVLLFFQKRVSFEPTTTYLLKDLRPFTTYTFQLAARSKHGVGAYTNEISAETPQTRRSSSFTQDQRFLHIGFDFSSVLSDKWRRDKMNRLHMLSR